MLLILKIPVNIILLIISSQVRPTMARQGSPIQRVIVRFLASYGRVLLTCTHKSTSILTLKAPSFREEVSVVSAKQPL